MKAESVVHKDLLIRVLEFCYHKEEFTILDILLEFNLNLNEFHYIMTSASSNQDAKQLFQQIGPIHNAEELNERTPEGFKGKIPLRSFKLTSTAIFNYLEYVELVEAKKNAISSKKIALRAIFVSVLAVAYPILKDLVTIVWKAHKYFWELIF